MIVNQQATSERININDDSIRKTHRHHLPAPHPLLHPHLAILQNHNRIQIALVHLHPPTKDIKLLTINIKKGKN